MPGNYFYKINVQSKETKDLNFLSAVAKYNQKVKILNVIEDDESRDSSAYEDKTGANILEIIEEAKGRGITNISVECGRSYSLFSIFPRIANLDPTLYKQTPAQEKILRRYFSFNDGRNRLGEPAELEKITKDEAINLFSNKAFISDTSGAVYLPDISSIVFENSGRCYLLVYGDDTDIKVVKDISFNVVSGFSFPYASQYAYAGEYYEKLQGLFELWKKNDYQTDLFPNSLAVNSVNRVNPSSELNLSQAYAPIAHTDNHSAVQSSVQFPQQQPLSNSDQDALFYACLNTCSVDVKRLLDQKIDPNCRDANGNTPIFIAAVNSDFDSVDYLCAAGADVNRKNKYNETPLMYVYLHRYSEIPLQLLLAKGANPYIESYQGNTVFTLAAKEGAKRPVELRALLEWELDNREKVADYKRKAKELEARPTRYASSQTNQLTASAIAAKPFISSPIHATVRTDTSVDENKNSNRIDITHGHLEIIFEKIGDSTEWRLEVLNNENSTLKNHSMIFSTKDSISKIKVYLEEKNINAFINFIETKGVSAKAISQYLREEIKSHDKDQMLRLNN